MSTTNHTTHEATGRPDDKGSLDTRVEEETINTAVCIYRRDWSKRTMYPQIY